MCLPYRGKSNSLNHFLDALAEMDEWELDRLQAALNHRRSSLKKIRAPS